MGVWIIMDDGLVCSGVDGLTYWRVSVELLLLLILLLSYWRVSVELCFGPETLG